MVVRFPFPPYRLETRNKEKRVWKWTGNDAFNPRFLKEVLRNGFGNEVLKHGNDVGLFVSVSWHNILTDCPYQ